MPDPYKIFDALAELVYISDIESHDLLYMNEPMRKLVGPEWRSMKCYEALHDKTEPCGFCNNDSLDADAFVAWNHFNEKFKRFYLLKDKLVDWEGRSARFEVAFDVSEQRERSSVLEVQLGLERLLVQCAMKLQSIDGFAGDMTLVLEMIGRYLEADRVYIFQVSPDGRLFRNTHEWCAEGVVPQIDGLQDVGMDFVGQWLPLLLGRRTVIVKDVEELRETAPAEYEMLSTRGIASVVDAPLLVGDKLIGSIGVDNPAAVHLDHCESFFTSLSYFLSIELERYRTKERFKTLSYTDSMTELSNRNRFIEDVGKLDGEGARSGFGVAYVDLNGLKDINDHEGHAQGDRVLKLAGDILKEAFSDALVYRMGGDEFLAVALDKGESEFAEQVAEARRKLADQACSMAMGVHYARTPCLVDDAVRWADSAMYADKRVYYESHPASARYREA